MIFNFPFSKTYRQKCPDGNIRVIHKNVENAFPLHIKSAAIKTQAEINGLKKVKAKINNEYKSKIEGVLYELDDMNSSLMIKFRSAYMLLQSNPCAGYERFANEITKINNEHHNLTVLRTKIKGLIDIACDDKKQVLSLFSNIISLMDDFNVGDKAKKEIAANRDLMKNNIAK